ncbi:DUF3467 domain-containing protein [Candidatus Woesearchaeota archaeon]|nr:DUF3467 domain-containing protein [Candidatus Woesearchaeota archaeon]
MAEEQLNLNIVDGDAFFAHELSVNFTPLQFTLDFKSITPRTDPRSKTKPSFVLKHNVIISEPWHLKQITDLLQNMLKRYEQEYGPIKKPAALVKAEKKQKSLPKKQSKSDLPTYFG